MTIKEKKALKVLAQIKIAKRFNSNDLYDESNEITPTLLIIPDLKIFSNDFSSSVTYNEPSTSSTLKVISQLNETTVSQFSSDL